MPDLTPEERRIVEAYSKRVDDLIARSGRRQAADVRRMVERFDAFRKRALELLPDRATLNRAAISTMLGNVARELDVLASDLVQTVRGGITFSEELADELASLYSSTFVAELGTVPIVSLRAVEIDLAADFSADLINLRGGGLTAEMLSRVNRVLRQGALGLVSGDNAFDAAREVARAMGEKRWTAAAERIYRTETLRIASIKTQAHIRELNRFTPTRKAWRWSGIERLQHRLINGQTTSADGFFVVPLREGGSVRMRFPRDPSAPASAVVNCGCFVIPVPARYAEALEGLRSAAA